MSRTTKTRGFGLVELLVVVAVLGVISVFGYEVFFEKNRAEALEKDASRVVSLLTRSYALTLSSAGGTQYGVHFDANRAILFSGSVYNAADPANREETLSVGVSMTNISIAGGGSDVVFERLTGKTANTGTVTFSLLADPLKTKTVTIRATGLVEVDWQ